MSNSLFSINLQLKMIKDFLDRVCASCSEELEAIEKRKMAGEYSSFETYEHDHSLPFVHVNIAVRTVGYEITSLIESELHSFAREAWLESTKHKGPKNIWDLDTISAESLTRLKMISDLPIEVVSRFVWKMASPGVSHLKQPFQLPYNPRSSLTPYRSIPLKPLSGQDR